MIKIKRDYQAFLDGYKPALIMGGSSKYLPLVEHYPCYHFDEDVTYFFQTDDKREWFVKKVGEIGKGSYEECCITGLILGYPEKSVKFFAENCEIDWCVA